MHFWVKTATIILGLAIFGTACAEARVSAVGSHEFLMTDASRPDPVDGSHRRQWIVELFYPTTPQRVTTGYAADPVLLDALVAETYYDTPVGELRSWATRRAPAVRDARPLTPRPLPLILLSPGSGFARLSYSELAARLVARGYVVAIIDHPYIGISHLPDGRMLDANNDPAQASEDPHALTPRVIEWSDDVSRVIDHLQAEAGRSIAPGLKIDFKRMAAAGHSVGGSVALDVCAHDVRIMACADFEGDLFGSRAETKGVRRPVLVTGSRAKGRPPIASATGQDVRTRMLTLLGQAGESSVWYVKVTGGSHTSFSDAPWVMPQTLSRFGGELMTPERSADLYTGMLDAFIRAYQAGGGGDASFQAFLGTATETQGGTLDSRLSAQPISEIELWRSYQQRDFFFLRDHLPRATENETNRVHFLRAATQVAFGEHAAAKQTLQQILAKMPDSEIEESTRRLLMREERSSYHYRAALAAIEPLTANHSGNGPVAADLQNSALLLQAISDASPQWVERVTGTASIQKDNQGFFPVVINGHATALGFDTGANFSFMAASVAKKLGLKIRDVKVSLGSSTGVPAEVRVAVDSVTIGSSRIHNVIFLILPDAGLTMQDGFFMPGMLGFPVMSALGPLLYAPDGTVHMGGAAPYGRSNLALDGNDVLLRVGFNDEQLICRLDSGADNTVFYEPFYRHFPGLFTDESRRHIVKLGGVSGAQDIPAYKLASVEFVLAERTVHLSGPDVMEVSIQRSPEDNYLACNIGLDALKSFGSYTIDLMGLHLAFQ